MFKIELNFDEILKDLREGQKTRKYVEDNLSSFRPRDAVLACKCYMPPSAYGNHLDNYLADRFGWRSPIDNSSGDRRTGNGSTIEIKVSIEAKNGAWNMSQLRPSHGVDFYVAMLYSITHDVVYFLCIPGKRMDKLILKHTKAYAHGTAAKKGRVTEEALLNPDNEFSLWFSSNPKQNHYFKLWQDLQPYIVTEDQLYEI